jgi:hypothetical protein
LGDCFHRLITSDAASLISESWLASGCGSHRFARFEILARLASGCGSHRFARFEILARLASGCGSHRQPRRLRYGTLACGSHHII